MTRQERLRLEFEERVERQRDEQRARSSAGSQRRDEHDESTTPAPRGEWLQRSGTSFLRTSPGEVTGRDQSYDDYIVKKYGPTPAREGGLQGAMDRLRDRLAGKRDDRLPLSQRPDPVPNPICPVDAVPLAIVSYTPSMRPAMKRCPVCGRTEREFLERGIDLTPVTEHVRKALNHEGWQKEHVIRRW